MQRTRTRGFGGLLVAFVSVALFAAAQAQTLTAPVAVELQLNEPAAPGGPEEAALTELRHRVRAATHGRVIVIARLNGAPDGAQAAVEAMMFAELTMLSGELTDYLPLMIDEVSGLSTPFLIPGPGPARRYLASPLLDEAREKVLHSRRIRFLETSALREPFHLIASRRPLRNGDDFSGLKLTSTTPLTKSAVRVWQALGVIYSSPGPPAALAVALREGRLDAVILPEVTSVSDSLAAVAPWLAGVDDCPRIWQVSINEASWRRLSPEDQKALKDAAAGAAAVFEVKATRGFQRDLARLTARTHQRYVELDALALRGRVHATYGKLVAEGGLSPRVLDAAELALSPPQQSDGRRWRAAGGLCDRRRDIRLARVRRDRCRATRHLHA